MPPPRKTIVVVVGTRPEAIKMAPVIRALRAEAAWRTVVVSTAQHRQMLDQVLQFFRIAPDLDLDLMKPDQTLPALTAEAMTRLAAVFAEQHPSLVLVQGDTTTAFVAALAGFYQGIPVGHVEAGLRTGDLAAPFPEEANRRLIAVVARLHFAPTAAAAAALRDEGVAAAAIHVTGNTVVDALEEGLAILDSDAGLCKGIERWWTEIVSHGGAGRANNGRTVLITGHRRESFGAGFESICAAIRELAQTFPEDRFVYPVHLNPNVRRPVQEFLGQLPNVILLDPVDYPRMLWLMRRSALILTDSGGLQEEAPTLGIPVLVMRETTERMEGVHAGTSVLVGRHRETIVARAAALLRAATPRAAGRAANPYGDGQASQRIMRIIKEKI